jgi:hypothetical protein
VHQAIRRSAARVAQHQRLAPQPRRRAAGQHPASGGPAARPADVLLAEAPVRQPAHQPAELGVVAELRVGIEGQMVGEQVDVVGKQRRQTPAHAGDATILPAPEIAVMDQHRIRAPRHRRISSAWLAVTPQTIRAPAPVLPPAGRLGNNP